MIELSIILPVHNEEDIIEESFAHIFKAVKRIVKSCEFILVENGSKDNSLEVVKEISQKYQNTRYTTAPRGYGSAVLAGLVLARGKIASFMDSDGQVDLKIFSKLWHEIQSGRWGLVQARRVTRENYWRKLVSVLLSFILAILFKTPLVDVNGKPKIFKKSNFDKLAIKSKDSFIEAELIIKMTKRGWKVKEIPTKTLPRLGGKSTRSVKTYFEFIVNILKFKFGKNFS